MMGKSELREGCSRRHSLKQAEQTKLVFYVPIGLTDSRRKTSAMKTHDISQTPLVLRFGVRGARLFAGIWFPIVYLAIIALVAKLWMVSGEVVEGPRRFIFGGLVAGFAVMATAFLTKMRLEFRSSIEELERQGTPPR
jgi:hypothetical protein